MKVYEIYHNKTRMIKYSFILLFGLVACIYMSIIIVEHYDDIGYQSTKMLRYKTLSLIMSIIGILFCSGGLMIMLYGFFKKKLRFLVFNQNGIYIHFIIGTIFVYWSEIKCIRRYKVNKSEFIGLDIYNMESLKRRYSGMKNAPIRVMCCGHNSITIALSTIKEKPDEVIAIMNDYWTKMPDEKHPA